MLVVKNPPVNARDIRDMNLMYDWGRYPEGGHGHPVQYSCMENPKDRGAWKGAVHRVIKDWTQLKQQHKRRLYTWTSPDGQHQNQIDYILCSQRWRGSIQSAKKNMSFMWLRS